MFNTMFNTVGKIMSEMYLKHSTSKQVSGDSFNDKTLIRMQGHLLDLTKE